MKYDYKCEDCGYIQEFITPFVDLTVLLEEYCPKCMAIGNESVSVFTRIFSPSRNFILKGGGWAKDNYSKQSKKEKTNKIKRKNKDE